MICDTHGRPVTPDQANTIIAQHWTVPAEARARRRSNKMGKAPQQVLTAQVKPNARRAGKRGDLPQPADSTTTHDHVNRRTA